MEISRSEKLAPRGVRKDARKGVHGGVIGDIKFERIEDHHFTTIIHTSQPTHPYAHLNAHPMFNSTHTQMCISIND